MPRVSYGVVIGEEGFKEAEGKARRRWRWWEVEGEIAGDRTWRRSSKSLRRGRSVPGADENVCSLHQ